MKHTAPFPAAASRQEVRMPAGDVWLDGTLSLPRGAQGVVLFAHGSGSSRHSPRNQFVADVIQQSGVGTLLFDLLTTEEEAEDQKTRALRFDIELLATRLEAATRWLQKEPATAELRIGFFGSSTGGGAALMAAADLGSRVGAVVSRGGRPDLAGDDLLEVKSPTLLIVGGLDHAVITLNQRALAQLQCEKELQIIPGATHLFEERGKLEEVARLSAAWFKTHLGGSVS
jgi:dienelactone hydrolase